MYAYKQECTNISYFKYFHLFTRNISVCISTNIYIHMRSYAFISLAGGIFFERPFMGEYIINFYISKQCQVINWQTKWKAFSVNAFRPLRGLHRTERMFLLIELYVRGAEKYECKHYNDASRVNSEVVGTLNVHFSGV